MRTVWQYQMVLFYFLFMLSGCVPVFAFVPGFISSEDGIRTGTGAGTVGKAEGETESGSGFKDLLVLLPIFNTS